MGIFDIIGPVMVGPSSSHTAGAARIGQTARAILGEPVKEARITLYGSLQNRKGPWHRPGPGGRAHGLCP